MVGWLVGWLHARGKRIRHSRHEEPAHNKATENGTTAQTNSVESTAYAHNGTARTNARTSPHITP